MGSIINIVRRDPRSGRMPYDETPLARSALKCGAPESKEGPTKWEDALRGNYERKDAVYL